MDNNDHLLDLTVYGRQALISISNWSPDRCPTARLLELLPSPPFRKLAQLKNTLHGTRGAEGALRGK